MGGNFPESKKGVSGGQVLGRFLLCSVNSYQVELGNQIQNLTIIGKILLAFLGRFWDNIFKRFYS